MTEEKVRETINECMDLYQRIYKIQMQIKEDREKEGARLAHLQKELPTLMASEALGELDNHEVAAVEAEIRKIENSLARACITYKGLQAREDSAQVSHAQALNFLRRIDAEGN